jgi:hypothetical protein
MYVPQSFIYSLISVYSGGYFGALYKGFRIYQHTVNSRLSVCGLSGLQIIHARLPFYINADMCELGFDIFPCCSARFRGGGRLVLGESAEDMAEQYLCLSVFYSQCRWWGGEVCSSGHGGREIGCYRYAWSFSNTISILQ